MQVKDIHFALKRKDSINYLMERFGYSSKEELFEGIRRIASSKSEDFIRRLEKNQKFSNRTKRNIGYESVDKNDGLKEEQIVQEDEENGTAEDIIEQEKESMPVVMDMESLKEYEEQLSAMICQLESRHKELVNRRRELNADLCKAQKALKELRRLSNVQAQNVTNLYEEYEECAIQMKVINQEKNSFVQLLEEVRGSISELNKVTIMIYSNGNIEVENAEIPSISEADVEEEVKSLVCMPEAEELKSKELKTIAKLLQIVKVYKNNDCPFELVFDSTEVQRFWETVSA